MLLPVEAIVQDVNAFLRGWAGYFRYGHSARCFSKIRYYVRMRIGLLLSKRYRRSRHFGPSGAAALRAQRVRSDQPLRDRRATQGGQALAG